MATSSKQRFGLAGILLVIGLALVIAGTFLQLQNPRTNEEDLVSLAVWAAGMFLVGTAIALPFARPMVAMLVGAVFPGIGYAIVLAIVWAYIILNALFG